jgi:hypothetical protein
VSLTTKNRASQADQPQQAFKKQWAFASKVKPI